MKFNILFFFFFFFFFFRKILSKLYALHHFVEKHLVSACFSGLEILLNNV